MTPSTTSSPDSVDPLVGTAATLSLEERLGHHFRDRAVLDLALTHRSWCAENGGESNERLEFLGDAVLGLVVTDDLFARHPGMPEGQMAKTRAAVVSSPTLAAVGADLGLGPELRLGKGEDVSGGREKASILADAVEAVFGAVYLDGGMDPARRLILDQMRPHVDGAATAPGGLDFKTRLQELAARLGHQPPRYQVTESGPDHDKRFRAVVTFDGVEHGEGRGSSKKEAEQDAARTAAQALGGEPDGRAAAGETEDSGVRTP